jgi:alkyl hydroperoxide reductase subunit AhpC
MFASLVFALLFVCSTSGHPHGPRVRHRVPSFTAAAVYPDFSFKDVTLEHLTRDDHWLLLAFYPADFTFVCPTEILAFSDRAHEFEERKVNVVFVSVDTKHTHLAWMNTPRKEGGLGRLKIPLIGDQDKSLSNMFNVLIDDETEDRGLATRSTFIISPNGILKHQSHNDLPVGRSVDEFLRLVDGYQFAEKHPNLGCPANWQKGKPNIKTDPVGSKEYFRSQGGDL